MTTPMAPPPGGDPRFGPAAPPAGPAGPVTTGFGAPAAQAGGFMVAPPTTTQAAPRRKTGGPSWAMPAIIGALLLVVAAVVGVYFLQGKQADNARSMFDHTTLAIPETAAGLTQGVGPGMGNAEAQTNLALTANLVVSPVSGSFLDANENSVAFIAVGKRVTGAKELDSVAASATKKWVSGVVGSGSQAPVALTVQDPGALGGVMQCGPTEVAGVPATFCVAVDEGSLAEILVAGTDLKTSAETARALREAVVTRTA